MTPVTPKAWYQSKTLWFNVAVLVSGILDLLSGSRFVTGDPQRVELLTIGVGTINLVLRLWFTGQPLTTNARLE